MPTLEVQRDEWVAFFEGFSRRHQGWLATVEVFGSDIGAQVEARELPLEGITAELKQEGADNISIFLGKTPDEHVTHATLAPIRVRLKQTEAGADEALEIESATETMILRFRSAMPPEMVDGM
jgi:hypothetical protein